MWQVETERNHASRGGYLFSNAIRKWIKLVRIDRLAVDTAEARDFHKYSSWAKAQDRILFWENQMVLRQLCIDSLPNNDFQQFGSEKRFFDR